MLFSHINTCSLCLRQPSTLVLVNAVVIGTIVVVVDVFHVIAVLLVTSVVVIVVVIVAVALCAWEQDLFDDIFTPGKWEVLICPLLMYFCLSGFHLFVMCNLIVFCFVGCEQ